MNNCWFNIKNSQRDVKYMCKVSVYWRHVLFVLIFLQIINVWLRRIATRLLSLSGCHCSDPFSIIVSLHFVNVSPQKTLLVVSDAFLKTVLARFKPPSPIFFYIFLLPKVTSEVKLEVKGDVCPPDGWTGRHKNKQLPQHLMSVRICVPFGDSVDVFYIS